MFISPEMISYTISEDASQAGFVTKSAYPMKIFPV